MRHLSHRRRVSERRSGLTPAESLADRVRAAATACGFDQVGFAPADPPVHASTYLDWIASGHHGEMAYMAREDAVRRRLDPTEALPGCRTIIVVSRLYGPGADRDGHAGSAIVARYAEGRDYHDVFEEGLDRLLETLREIRPDVRARRYVDYGPVMERDHAQRAGLGWIGKNTMLIDPGLGSYLMLGELLTDLEIEPDDPFLPDRCGTCTRCLDACPTGAILPGRVVDSRRCISYLTIELKGPIPVDLRPAIGTRVFGCDICQEVCPWNSDAPTPAEPAFAGGGVAPPSDLIAWAEELRHLDQDAYRERYRGTAFSRSGRDGLLRNLAVGLGNSGSPAAGPTLEALAGDSSDLVAEHALWGLERLRGHV